MKQLTDLQEFINEALDKLTFPQQPSDLYEPISYILSLGGKRLRPALLLMACDLFGGDVESAVQPALAIEVFHNFTLMHDDIMDNAPLRRGQVTVHEKWNANVAILSGDAMMVESNKLMMQVPDTILRHVMDVFNETATGVCEGQQIDMSFEQRSDVIIDEYLNMIRLKTAVLLGGTLKIGAIIGGAAPTDAQLLYDFGVNLGIAFQLQDDILDVYGDPEKFGKQVGGDIISNKKTYLLIKALELAKDHQAYELNKWLTMQLFDVAEKVTAVTGIYNELQIRKYAEEAMHNFADKAFKALDNINLPEERRQYLRQFADSLLVREY
ncbi:geranylgeranyl diphosphate synthase, type II [Mucilaginibacter lappiensis]|uniref:Geranylgeranyl diphosphate synthase type II n=1 Tax=Mucilaginibacter lappiensis TaxID=354630 RepID=A0ABR6PHQ3_9SPHI|nr:polyprenyl synthetase family protein [Mucilaginibacter lappiensis]MBB6109282.1 geranylgeranyl diphosphate synthase type II [Mucilaginibacter lappiensis]SIR01818.1 geranylgeranyl diphosphate synthase, type II [Mucilaginibacter lappiensis]